MDLRDLNISANPFMTDRDRKENLAGVDVRRELIKLLGDRLHLINKVTIKQLDRQLKDEEQFYEDDNLESEIFHNFK